VEVAVGVGLGVLVPVGEAVAVGVTEGVKVGVEVAVGVADGVCVGVRMGDEVSVDGRGVNEGEGAGVAVTATRVTRWVDGCAPKDGAQALSTSAATSPQMRLLLARKTPLPAYTASNPC
jgi:hypothetical protein